MIREARFAGTWYPGDADALREQIQAATPQAQARPARVVVAPHAGYRYSLGIAAETYARVRIPKVVVVLCPNHAAPPPIVSVWSGGAWSTPLGAIPTDEDLAQRILAECPGAVADTSAHEEEHAIELHLPILQTHQPALKIVPIVVAAPGFEALRSLGEGLAAALEGRDDVLIVASTDMTHFKSAQEARAQDERALDHLLRLDAEGLLDRCVSEGITMCGVRPTTAALVAAVRLGATSAELVRYGHSGETSGDDTRVVGYAGAIIW